MKAIYTQFWPHSIAKLSQVQALAGMRLPLLLLLDPATNPPTHWDNSLTMTEIFSHLLKENGCVTHTEIWTY